MSRRIQIGVGYKDVIVPENRRLQAGDQATVTDAQFAGMASAVTAGVIIDLGLVADGTGSVTVNGKTGISITLVPADLGLPKITINAVAPTSPAVGDLWGVPAS